MGTLSSTWETLQVIVAVVSLFSYLVAVLKSVISEINEVSVGVKIKRAAKCF